MRKRSAIQSIARCTEPEMRPASDILTCREFSGPQGDVIETQGRVAVMGFGGVEFVAECGDCGVVDGVGWAG